MKLTGSLMLTAAACSLLFTVPVGSAAAPQEPRCDLRVVCDTGRHMLRGQALWHLPEGGDTVVGFSGLTILAARLNGEPVTISGTQIAASGTLTLDYEAHFAKPADVPDDNPGVVSGGMLRPEGISLTAGWYPAIAGLARYRLTAVVPNGMTAVSESDTVTQTTSDGGQSFEFDFPHPLPGITLVAGPYRVSRDTWNSVAIETYFFTDDAGLEKTYINYVKQYLERYTTLIGPYPYRRFAVVENRLATGYSMPTFTLLGSSVIRLPFIVSTSLGHEVLHQWFGCSVYADYAQGNWSEGLAAYLADHLQDELTGSDAAHRKRLLVDYRNYVNQDNELPLKAFTGRSDYATRAVGYGKAAMLFHMLRRLVEQPAFDAALRSLAERFRFRRAAWSDIRAVFEEACRQDLGWFFEQWLERKGAPDLQIRNARVEERGGRRAVTFGISQRGTPYRLDLPVEIITVAGSVQQTVSITKADEQFSVPLDDAPRELVLDGSYDLMRRLAPAEVPPVISGLLGCPTRMLVLPDSAGEDLTGLAVAAAARGYRVKQAREVQDRDLETTALLAVGPHNRVLQRLFGTGAAAKAGAATVLLVRKNPLNSDEVAAALSGGNARALERCFRKLQHYGRYSKLVFEEGQNTEKTVAPAAEGIRAELRPPVYGLQPQDALSLDDILDRIKDVPVIFVGEQHTAYEDHLVQLEVVRALHAQGRDIAVGMEMFQRPFQQPLDDYIAGRSDEKTYLKDTEYYSRWKYNYHLYRAIIDYARANGIPVVALNARAEIVKKVSGHGLDSLSAEERALVPQDMDMADAGYRSRLQETFEQHPSIGRAFANFYQAQILWDETMAHSVADHLAAHPGRQMVVLAGAGHIAYGSGIPGRVRRLTGKPTVTLLRLDGQQQIAGIADYVLFAKSRPAPSSPPMGVIISAVGNSVVIDGFAAHSPAEQAGIKKGDRLLKLDGVPVAGVDDVLIELLDRASGDTVQAEVLRHRAILPDRTMKFDVKLR